jgi:hypothetical protein
MQPTLICLRFECNEENCRKREMREPRPKGFLMLDLNAQVGAVFCKTFNQAACQVVSTNPQ